MKLFLSRAVIFLLCALLISVSGYAFISAIVDKHDFLHGTLLENIVGTKRNYVSIVLSLVIFVFSIAIGIRIGVRALKDPQPWRMFGND